MHSSIPSGLAPRRNWRIACWIVLAAGWPWTVAAAGPEVVLLGIQPVLPPSTRLWAESETRARLAGLEGPLSPAERALFEDAADRAWDRHSLLTAALVASGVPQEQVPAYEARVARLVTELLRQDLPTVPRLRARRLFEFLHHRVLRGGYQLEATDLRIALDQGRFNCVSATVLFNCMAEAVAIDASRWSCRTTR